MKMIKKLANLRSLAIIAIIAVMGFGMIACDDGGGEGTPVFSVSGEFKGSGTGNALFKARTDATARSARSAGVNTYEMSGELEDGDLLLKLKGTFDPADNSYTVSAAASFLRYTVNGNANGATATLAVKDAVTEDWNSFIVSVTYKEVNVKGGNATEYAGGIPSWAWGTNMFNQYIIDHTYDSEGINQRYDDGNWGERTATISQWYFTNNQIGNWNGILDNKTLSYTVVEAIKVNDDVYDIIFTYPVYKATKAQEKAAAEAFFRENNIRAMLWEEDYMPWDDEASSVNNADGFFNNMFYKVEDGDLTVYTGWEVNRSIYQKWWKDKYLYNYLVNNYNDSQLEKETWFSRIKFTRRNDSELFLQFYEGSKSGLPGYPEGDSKELSVVKAYTDNDLYPGYHWSQDYNLSANPESLTKPLILYVNDEDPIWGYGWVNTVGNIFCWYDLDETLDFIDGWEPEGWNRFETVTMDYTKYNKINIQFKDDPPFDWLGIGIASGIRNNDGEWSAYFGELRSSGGEQIGYDYSLKRLVWNYKEALSKVDDEGYIWINDNPELTTDFDLTKIYQIQFSTYTNADSTEENGWKPQDLDIINNIEQYIEKIWLSE